MKPPPLDTLTDATPSVTHTLALAGLSISQNVQIVDRSIDLKELFQVLLFHRLRNLSDEHLDGVRVELWSRRHLTGEKLRAVRRTVLRLQEKPTRHAQLSVSRLKQGGGN